MAPIGPAPRITEPQLNRLGVGKTIPIVVDTNVRATSQGQRNLGGKRFVVEFDGMKLKPTEEF